MNRRSPTLAGSLLAVCSVACIAVCITSTDLRAQRRPHNQDRVPGPALSPREALAKFEVPDGFRIELVASEPDIVNPIKMTFDTRGRIWLVESLEYPRREPGEGRDRIKVLEDTDGDGVIDRFSVFADGLNIPCGVAVGHGGVFVTNSPDILFLQDTDGDGVADRREVVLTGFGRHDTHELPNSLAWGPDGWLYGLNGVFNPAHIEHRGQEYRFTCALWRYHPRTRDFELFAEGTSNPWGVGFDREGAAFVEACVIDHLFHLAETGYYHRQAGAYPPFTWKAESIVKHRNYKAAYCGLDFYDADVYPEEYRNLVYIGNIHGNCINADSLTRSGSTYFARRGPIVMKTDDAWFMPVDIRLAPDGCFWVLDWYDRYHCYQDARRDPKGIDRGRGRLWRVAYGDVEQPRGYDLEKESADQLIARLGSANRWWRDTARMVLAGRRDAASYPALRRLVLDREARRFQRMQALWTLISCDDPGSPPQALADDFHRRVLAMDDGGFRAWGVRAAGNARAVSESIRDRVRELATDPHPDVRLQVATAARKLFDDREALVLLLEVLSRSQDDPLIPRIVWRNLEPLLEAHGGALVAWLEKRGLERVTGVEGLLGRFVDRLLARRASEGSTLVGLVTLLLADPSAHAGAAAQCLEAVSQSVATGEIDDATLAALKPHLAGAIGDITRRGAKDPLYLPAVSIAASWGEPAAVEACRALLRDASTDAAARGRALRALLGADEASIVEFAGEVLATPASLPRELLIETLSALGKIDRPEVATLVLQRHDALPPAVRPRAIDLLSQRPSWARALLDRIESGKIDSRSLNVTQLRRLLGLGDEGITRRVQATWGKVREGRNPDREKVIARMRKVLEKGESNVWRGKAVYAKACAQCHVIFGEGHTVGPDITVNGRETLDLLLSNLLDPNLVVGKDYTGYTLVTKTGRVLSGLLIEDSPQRVVLRVAGGQDEVVPRREVLRVDASPVSLMPEDLEKTITEDEFRDLIAYLRFDEPPPEPLPELGEGLEGSRLSVERDYGVVTVNARFPGASESVELLTYNHSNDQRPFIHPLRAPRGGPTLTALRPDDHPWQYGVFTGHARINGIDFWHERGWIRSRGLESIEQHADRIEIVSKSHWMTQRRGGQRVLVERQKVVVHAPARDDSYAVDFEWALTPDVALEIGRYDYGGLAFRPAAHRDRRHERPDDAARRPWQDMSGRFGGEGESGRVAGVAIFDHPRNPGFPNGWRVDGQALINPAITVFDPIELDAGETITFRYRLLVHDGHGDRDRLNTAHAAWASPPR